MIAVGGLDERNHAIFDRLEVTALRMLGLAQDDHQNALRAANFFWSVQRYDAAEILIERASQLADNAEELLRVAIAWHRCGFASLDVRQDLGFTSLRRAARETQTVGLRIEIARVLCDYRQLLHARHILREDGIIESHGDLPPLLPNEFVSLLRCHTCLEKDEQIAIATRSIQSFRSAIECGKVGVARKEYIQRLHDVIRETAAATDDGVQSELDGIVAHTRDETVPDDVKESGEANGESSPMTIDAWNDLEQVLSPMRLMEMDADELNSVLAGEARSLAEKSGMHGMIVYWTWLSTTIENFRSSRRSVWPKVPAERTPMVFAIDGKRQEAASELWRHVFHADSGDETPRNRLSAFLEEESTLHTEWRDLQASSSRGHADRAVILIKEAMRALDTIRLLAVEEADHSLSSVRPLIAVDVPRLKLEMARVAEELRLRCEGPSSRKREPTDNINPEEAAVSLVHAAEVIARSRGHEFIFPEHLLLASLETRRGMFLELVGPTANQRTADQWAIAIATLLPEPAEGRFERIPWSNELNEAASNATLFSRVLSCSHIRVEHFVDAILASEGIRLHNSVEAVAQRVADSVSAPPNDAFGDAV